MSISDDLGPALSSLPVAIVITDSKGVVLWANARVTEITGYPAEELAGRNLGMLRETPSDDPHPCARRTEQVALRHRTGTRISVELSVAPLAGPAPAHLVWTLCDLPAKARAADEIDRRYSALYDSMYEGVAIHRLVRAGGKPVDYILLDVNRRFEEILGIRRELVLGKLATQAYHTDSAPYLQEYASVCDSKKPFQFDVYFAPMAKHFSISVAPVADDLFATIFFDTTSQKTVEEQYRLISENTADVIWLFDLNQGHCTYVSPSVEKLRGFTSEAVMAQSLADVFPADAYAFVNTELQRRVSALNAGDERARTGTDEYPFLCKDGTAVETETATTILADDSGKARFVVGVTRDIRERKRLEKALRESEEKFAKAFLSNPVPSALADFEGENRLIEVNSAFEQLFGYRREEASGKTAAELNLWAVPGERDRLVEELRAGRRVRGFETHYRKKDGQIAACLASAEVVELHGRKCVLATIIDITERKATAEALRLSQQRFLRVFRSSPAAMSLNDIADDGRFIDVNEAFERITGYTRDEVVGKAMAELCLWDSEDEHQEALDQLKRTGSIRNLEHRFRKKNGEIGIGLLSTELLDIDGSRYAVATNVEITERKKAEEALKKAKLHLQLMADNLNEAVLAYDMERHLVFVNPAIQDLTGYTVEEMKRQHFICWIHPADRERMLAAWDSLFSGHTYSGERYRLVTRYGEEKWVEASWGPLRDEAGVQIGVQGVERDITKRYLAEDALQHTNLRLQLALSSGGLGIWDWDIVSDTLVWDDRMFEIYGLDRSEFTCRFDAWLEMLHPEDRAQILAVYDRVLKEGLPIAMEFRVNRPDGSMRYVKVDGIVVRNNAGEAVRLIGLNADVTEAKQAAEERTRLAAQLVQAQKMESIGRLAGGVAHDFNNLLTVINGYSKLALSELGPNDPLAEELEEISKAGERAAGLTRQLLAFSRQQVLEPKVLDLNGVVWGMRSMLERLMGEDIRLSFGLSRMALTVHADAHQLEQVILNLVVNARDAMPGGGSLAIETSRVKRDESYAREHPAVSPGEYAVLKVADTGIGMDEATQARVFEPFFTTKGAGRGTGLGLSMVQGIIEQSGGHIDVASAPGAGTLFSVYLPIVTGAKAEATRPGTATLIRGTETILVVEDQDEVRRFAVSVLKTYGYRVLQATGAAEALKICLEDRAAIDLVLTDVVMPEIGGRELIARLAEARPDIKALFMSGYAENNDLRSVLGGAGHFLQKPFTPEALANKVRAILGSR